ncbi:DUF1642 domain-containing protein [Listeria monocytogenes]|nr:DUF1642 domain-containing protein [Listeria monocytogenes]
MRKESSEKMTRNGIAASDKVKSEKLGLSGIVKEIGIHPDFPSDSLMLKGISVRLSACDFKKVERIKIPRLVAEFIDTNKRNGVLIGNVLEPGYPPKEVEKWLYQSSSHSDHVQKQYLFFRAWMDDDYEIEEEQLYYVKLGASKYDFLNIDPNGRILLGDTRSEFGCKPKFTEQEIKAYDERHWAFAVKVEDDDK